MTQEQKAFIERVGALAAADMQKSGVLASLTIAQAILESGWGKSGLTVKANALFGIKAGTSWKGRVYSTKTQECYNGVTFTTVTALFRAYDSWEESVADHSALLTGAARYKAVVGERDYKTACRAIKAAGYKTLYVMGCFGAPLTGGNVSRYTHAEPCLWCASSFVPLSLAVKMDRGGDNQFHNGNDDQEDSEFCKHG